MDAGEGRDDAGAPDSARPVDTASLDTSFDTAPFDTERFDAARARLAPAVGDRAADLLALNALRASDRPVPNALVERIRARGDDPDGAPQLTEAEAVMVLWIASEGEGVTPAELESVAGPELRTDLLDLVDAARDEPLP